MSSCCTASIPGWRDYSKTICKRCKLKKGEAVFKIKLEYYEYYYSWVMLKL